MVPTTRRAVGVAAAFAGVLALAACSSLSSATGNAGGTDATAGGGEKVELQYAFYAPEGTHAGQQMIEWAEQLNQRTDGQVEVKLFMGGTLLGTGDIYDGVSSGVVDVGLDSPHNDEGRFPMTSVMGLPLGITNAQVGSKVMLDLIEEFEPAEYDGYEVITAFTAEPSFVQTVEPVRTADDLKNLQLRVGGQNVRLAEDLGAAPIGMPISEVAEALQTGVVDGYISSRDVLKDFGLGEMIRYTVDYPFGLAGTFVAVMDEDEYAALPDNVRAEIEALRPEMMQFAATYQDEESVGKSVQWAEEEYGLETVELEPSEAGRWDAAAEDAVEAWLAKHSEADFDAQAVLDRARELVDQYEG
jgi:TRAP-type transport system periplasmic protein